MKAVSAEEAVAMIPNGASIMVGGFMGVGTPERLLDELVRQKKSGLSLISNDAATPECPTCAKHDQVSRIRFARVRVGTKEDLRPPNIKVPRPRR